MIECANYVGWVQYQSIIDRAVDGKVFAPVAGVAEYCTIIVSKTLGQMIHIRIHTDNAVGAGDHLGHGYLHAAGTQVKVMGKDDYSSGMWSDGAQRPFNQDTYLAFRSCLDATE